MSKANNIDLTGKRFGKLTVTGFSHKTPKVKYWKCICDCGKECIKNQYNLVGGYTNSCGCLRNRLKDLTGMRFGRLTVIERDNNKGTKTMWKCRCDCGNVVTKCGSDLKIGDVRSCGCLRSETTSKRSLNDLTGQRFGKLTIIKRATNKGKETAWECLCDCGNVCHVSVANLRSGTKSCGCLRHEGRNAKHGKCNTRLYTIWSSMKERCFNKNSYAYKWYGMKGIIVCDEWRGENGFENFYNWAMQNGYKQGLSIDRIDVYGNYEPSNCRWADMITQANNKSNTLYIRYNGKSETVRYWSEKTGMRRSTIYSRHKKGWSAEEIFNTPLHGKRGEKT